MTSTVVASPSFRRPPAAAVAACALLPLAAVAADNARAPVATLKPVIVSASRQEQFSDDLPVSADVLDAQELERGQIHDIRDAARDLPNVSVRHAPARFALTGPANNTGRDGNAGFTIRGLGGNRVLMLVDGVRMPRSYVFGGNAFGRDYLSLDLVKRVEVVRGAASALYGSDGMGGLVNFITWEPADLLAGEAPKRIGGRLAAAWSGDDDGRGAAATVATRASETAEWLISASGRRVNALDTRGDNDAPDLRRTRPNPQDDRDRALLAKVVLRPGAGQKHVLTGEHVDRRSDVNLLSSRAALPLSGTPAQQAAAVMDERAWGTMERNRLTWGARIPLETGLADRIDAVLGVQEASSRQFGTSDLNARPDRERDVRYDERTWHASAQAGKSVALAGEQSLQLTYGAEFVRSRITNLYTGINSLPPEVFPLKRFPDTRESTAALYGQGEWTAGPWTVVPGLRLDRFELEALTQAGFFPPAKTLARSLSGSAASPKLGVMFRAGDTWSVFGSAAGGFRAPNANQVNGYYENAAEHVVVIPNPDLQPEKSRTLEVGLRGRSPRFSVDLALFTGRFSNLIVDTVLVSGTGTAADPKLFQTRNVERASIRGFEAKGRIEAGAVGAGRLGIPFAFGTARGVNRTTGRPLNSVDPWQLMAGVDYRTPSWDLRLDLRHQAAKKAEDIDSAALVKAPNTQITVPAVTTLDLSGQWRIRKDLRLTASIVNLTNRKYWLWSDVQGLAAAAPAADAYTQPGRHLRVSLVAQF
ncbi:MAG TPA: TonB-dependent hemoglobin/transferrin/lactoferrin family receptor [Azospirillum sp.]